MRTAHIPHLRLLLLVGSLPMPRQRHANAAPTPRQRRAVTASLDAPPTHPDPRFAIASSSCTILPTATLLVHGDATIAPRRNPPCMPATPRILAACLAPPGHTAQISCATNVLNILPNSALLLKHLHRSKFVPCAYFAATPTPRQRLANAAPTPRQRRAVTASLDAPPTHPDPRFAIASSSCTILPTATLLVHGDDTIAPRRNPPCLVCCSHKKYIATRRIFHVPSTPNYRPTLSYIYTLWHFRRNVLPP